MKTYEGRREGSAPIVTVNGARLNPRLDLYNHSPSGFEWGYGGSGPAQLALAILADCLGAEEALDFYQDFKRLVIANLPNRGWALTKEQIENSLRSLRLYRDLPQVNPNSQEGACP